MFGGSLTIRIFTFLNPLNIIIDVNAWAIQLLYLVQMTVRRSTMEGGLV